jgi:hypothetical protein
VPVDRPHRYGSTCCLRKLLAARSMARFRVAARAREEQPDTATLAVADVVGDDDVRTRCSVTCVTVLGARRDIFLPEFVTTA